MTNLQNQGSMSLDDLLLNAKKRAVTDTKFNNRLVDIRDNESAKLNQSNQKSNQIQNNGNNNGNII